MLQPVIRQQEIFFVGGAPGELFGEGAVGRRGFSEDDDAGGFLVEPVDDGERGPAGFAVAQPFVKPFARKRRWRVGVQAGGFVDHEQVFVFVQHARRAGD